ncbi:CAP domain-containing protein [Priestia megaterium]|uniref:CAP domain-containing protein n=1 Tax=Priestia megaterium TaxID=1404 RepID=UPI002E1B6146|nr:CAP domain-containing protein [Priestia megaterium]
MVSKSNQCNFLIQSDFGNKGHFEVVVPSHSGGLNHYYRNNDSSDHVWYGPSPFGSGNITGASLIQSNYGRNFEVIACRDNTLVHYRRHNDKKPYEWGEETIATGVTGQPAIIQSNIGSIGNFEVVVPLVKGGLAHFRRYNDENNEWGGPTEFGSGKFTGVSLIQSNYGGNFEVVACKNNTLVHYRRYNDNKEWAGGETIATGVTGQPAIIQSNIGSKGNFEVVVPLVKGGLAHFRRYNDENNEWGGPTEFGSGKFTGASLIQSNYEGNFEVVAYGENKLFHYNRDKDKVWNKGIDITENSNINGVLKAVNEERVKNGMQELIIDDVLMELANVKVKDMSYDDYPYRDQHGPPAHISPRLGSPLDQARAVGYYHYPAELAGRGYDYTDEMMQGWLDSPGHRPWIVDPNYGDGSVRKLTHFGVGYYSKENSKFKDYWVLILTNKNEEYHGEKDPYDPNLK